VCIRMRAIPSGRPDYFPMLSATPAKREHPGVFNDRFARSRSLLHFTACPIVGCAADAELAVRIAGAERHATRLNSRMKVRSEVGCFGC
jgi:hypothetical protein